MTKTITAISPRTDAEWPPDHPLRRSSVVMPVDQIKKVGDVLICTIVGEVRQPPADDDRDVEAACTMCPNRVVHRASAPKNLKPICWHCWQGIAT